MAVIVDKILNHTCRLGVWQIDESYQWLLSRLNLDESEKQTIESFKNHKRKLEWLSVRVLLNKMTRSDQRIIYNGNRKPFLRDKSFNISISHSEQYTTVLLSPDSRVGVDIEKMKSKIVKVANKFLTDEELSNVDEEQEIFHLYLYWCAKESLYKLFDKKNIYFKEDIFIEPFVPSDKGVMFGRVNTSSHRTQERLQLNYFRLGDYSLVWTYKK